MPWSESQVIDERLLFVKTCDRGVWSIGQVSAAYGVTEPVNKSETLTG